MAIKIDGKQIAIATQCLKDGGIIAFPTDTVYGLAAKISHKEIQDRLKLVKGRPEEKPFPVVVGSLEQVGTLAKIDKRAECIMKKWWPGALTIILNKKEELEDWVSNGKSTIALRMIDDIAITQMIKDVGVPLFLTSANLSDEPVCLSGEEVEQRLGSRIDVVIDGRHQDNQPSTILDCTQEKLVVLREGPITLEEIEKSLEGE